MSDPQLVVATREDRLELVVNFGVFAGRDATRAEIERLAQALLPQLESVEIVCEQRYEFGREREATIYQVRVEAPPPGEGASAFVRDAVEEWARACIAERRFISI